VNTEVVVALIVSGFAFLGTVVEVMRRQNHKDHFSNASKLDRVLEATNNLKDGHRRIEKKIDNHINDHAKGEL
jgi:hypothetical protein